MKVGTKLGKVKKFGIGWCIPHRVVADNAHGIGLRKIFDLRKIFAVPKDFLKSKNYCTNIYCSR